MRYKESIPPVLEDTHALLEALHHPEAGLNIIHIAGTNGKGSTAAFLSEMLCRAGYRTGLFTSPHLLRYSERIRVDGEEIEKNRLAGILGRVEKESARLRLPYNYFRTATVASFLYFSEQGCDFAVMEAGMGGRLDPTNVIACPLLTIITRVALDHMDFLGDTIEKIAKEKAGIIKNGVPVLTILQQESVMAELERTAEEKNAPFFQVSPVPIALLEEGAVIESEWGNVPITNGGLYQGENAALAIQAAKLLRRQGVRLMDQEIKEGLMRAHWPGRFEWMRQNPPVLFDGAHNENGVEALVKSIQARWEKAVFIVGFMENKAYLPSLAHLGDVARAMIAVCPPDERGIPAQILKEKMRPFCEETYAARDMEHALSLAHSIFRKEEVICVCGSLYLHAPLALALEKKDSMAYIITHS